jgi:hypothetical protein
MRLGEMLMRDGRIGHEQLEAAIEHQRSVGGKLGSIFVELGHVDVETLTVYLGLELGIPIANGPTLERCKRSAVRLLTPRQALRFRCVPIVIQGQTLILAIDDPHDLVRLDELTALTGYRVLPRVAPEIRIYYYLERFYGVRRPGRFAALGESIRGSSEVRTDLPAPPLPGLPSIKEPRDGAASPPVIMRLQRATEGTEDEEILELDAADLVVELDADETELAGSPDDLPESSADAPARRRITQMSYEPIDLESALAATREAQSRNDVARAMMRFAAGNFETAALFMIRDNLAFGWKAFGPDLEPDYVDLLCIPLSAPSVFQVAAASDEPFFGPPFPSTLHNYLFRGLGCLAPQIVCVAAVQIGSRPVNILYGHNEGVEPPDLVGLNQLCAAAADSYVRLISGYKRKRRESAPPFETA